MIEDKTLRTLFRILNVAVFFTILWWPVQAAYLDQTDIVEISNHTLDKWDNQTQDIPISGYTDYEFTCTSWGDVGCSNYHLDRFTANITLLRPPNVKVSIEGIDLVIMLLTGIFSLTLIGVSVQLYSFIFRRKVV